MADTSMDLEELRRKAATLFLPSAPITTAELLYGRTVQLRQARNNLTVPGRTVFIHGERGVGKTSLAKTVAYEYHHSSSDPPYVGCDPNDDFNSLAARIIRRCLGQVPGLTKKEKRTRELGLQAGALTLLERIESEPSSTSDIRLTPDETVEILSAIQRTTRNAFVVVLDEVDVLPQKPVRQSLAFLIKALGDHECSMKFVMAGIGSDIGTLLTGHESASRYLAATELKPLGLDVLRDMITDNFGRLGAHIWPPVATRIACIADGYAHFVHLIGLHLAQRMLDADALEAKPDFLSLAIGDAVADAAPWLRTSYETAIQKYKDRYEPILWALSHHWELVRSTEQLFPVYVRLCELLRLPSLERKDFSLSLNNLKGKAHGNAVLSNRRSWFRLRESMLRGYCRMVAESKGINLGLEYLQSEDHLITKAAQAGTGRASTLPEEES